MANSKRQRELIKSIGWQKLVRGSTRKQKQRKRATFDDFTDVAGPPTILDRGIVEVIRHEGQLADEAIRRIDVWYPEAGDPVIVKRPDGQRRTGVLVRRMGRYCWVRDFKSRKVITTDIASVRLNR
jgi:hypothetical protein